MEKLNVWSVLEQRQHWAMEEVSNYDSGGLSGGSHVYAGPRDLIFVCVLAPF